MLDFYEIVLLILLGISMILALIRFLLSIIKPEKPAEVKGIYVKGHYDTYVVGNVVCQVWHCDE